MKCSLVLMCMCALTLMAQGTEPKPDASGYPVHGSAGTLNIGAEYLVHYVPAKSGGRTVSDFLVVEVAMYGPSLTRMEIAYDNFSLRVDGKKEIAAQPPFEVLAASKKSNWPTPVPGNPGGRGPVIFGDPRGTIPSPYPRSGPNVSTRRTTDPVSSDEDEITHTALPIGQQTLPVSGVIFFPYKGKTDKIKSLELEYSGPAGKVTLKLL